MKRKRQELDDIGSPLIVRPGTDTCCLDRWTEREMEGSLSGPHYLGVRRTLSVLLQMQLSKKGRGLLFHHRRRPAGLLVSRKWHLMIGGFENPGPCSRRRMVGKHSNDHDMCNGSGV
jgi:hypothetical protein